MSPDVVSALITSVLGLVGIVVAALLGRHAGAKHGLAAIKEAETNAREAATADWASYTASLNKWTHELLDRLTKVEGRLAEAEGRTAQAEARAMHAESLYSISLDYLRKIARWCGERHGEPMPEPPPALAADL